MTYVESSRTLRWARNNLVPRIYGIRAKKLECCSTRFYIFLQVHCELEGDCIGSKRLGRIELNCIAVWLAGYHKSMEGKVSKQPDQRTPLLQLQCHHHQVPRVLARPGILLSCQGPNLLSICLISHYAIISSRLRYIALSSYLVSVAPSNATR